MAWREAFPVTRLYVKVTLDGVYGRRQYQNILLQRIHQFNVRQALRQSISWGWVGGGLGGGGGGVGGGGKRRQ